LSPEEKERKFGEQDGLQAPRKATVIIMGRTNLSRRPKPVSVTLELAVARQILHQKLNKHHHREILTGEWRHDSRLLRIASFWMPPLAAGRGDRQLHRCSTLTPPLRLQKSLLWGVGAERSELLGKKFKKFWNQPKWGSPLLEGDLR
jgi:hypothetical protein